MTDAGVFPRSVDPTTALDFYLQACSVEVDTAFGANVAATLAAGGVSPLTGERCLSAVTTKATLTLMFSCGMYDYSGEWMSAVDLPAKSGVSGIIYVVVPHIMGIAVFAPPLDSHGNSVRGVEFCKRLLREYDFGVFDQIVGGGGDGLSVAGGGAGAAAGLRPTGARKPPQITARQATAREILTKSQSQPGPTPKAEESAAPANAPPPGASVVSANATDSSDPRQPPPFALDGGPPPSSSSMRAGPTAAAAVAAAASMIGSSDTAGRSTAASGQRIEKVRRLGLAFRRLSCAWMLLRAWSGLPVAAGDLALLKVRDWCSG